MTEWLKCRESPQRGSSDAVYRGEAGRGAPSAFHVLQAVDPDNAAPTTPIPPPLLHPLFLFLIIELNGIKSFSIGIFLCSHPFEQPEGDFNMLLPFDTAAVLEVEELRGI